MAPAPPRIKIERLDQLADRALAIAQDLRGCAFGDGDDLPAHHKYAVVVSLDLALDDDPARVRRGMFKGRSDRLRADGANAHAAAMISIERLYDDWAAQAARERDRLFSRAHDPALGNGNAGLAKQRLGQRLVASGLHADVGRRTCDARPHQLLATAVAKAD